jgi:hypothetical protein
MNDDPRLDHASELWRSQPVNLSITLEKSLLKHQRARHIRVLMGVGFTLMVCWMAVPFADILSTTDTFLERFAMLLMFVGCGYLLSQAHDLIFQLAKERSADGLSRASVEHYRSELAKLRDFSSGRIFWTRYLMLVPPYVLYFIATAISSQSGTSLWYNPGIPIAISLAVIPLNLWGARRAQRRIDMLTSALNESQ